MPSAHYGVMSIDTPMSTHVEVDGDGQPLPVHDGLQVVLHHGVQLQLAHRLWVRLTHPQEEEGQQRLVVLLQVSFFFSIRVVRVDRVVRVGVTDWDL